MWIVKWTFAALLIIFIIGFAMQNTDQLVSVSFLKWHSDIMPVWMLMYVSFVVGLFSWLFISILITTAGRTDKIRLEKENQILRQELDRLRNLSVEESITALGLTTNPNQENEG